MKKIVFSTLAMRKQLYKFIYKIEGNSSLQYDKPVYFPVNGVLGKTLQKGDDVKVVLMKTMDYEKNTSQNEEIFKQELIYINKTIGAHIEFITIESPFVETYDTHEKIMRKIIAQFEMNAEIIADLTYGPKTQAIAMFSALKFAEKFYNADIKNIVYGKVDFKTLEDGTSQPVNPELYNLTSLYFLDSIINSLKEDTSPEKALATLDLLLKI